eukprot:9554468-Ditylum_brightwellii.AAC.1
MSSLILTTSGATKKILTLSYSVSIDANDRAVRPFARSPTCVRHGGATKDESPQTRNRMLK